MGTVAGAIVVASTDWPLAARSGENFFVATSASTGPAVLAMRATSSGLTARWR